MRNKAVAEKIKTIQARKHRTRCSTFIDFHIHLPVLPRRFPDVTEDFDIHGSSNVADFMKNVERFMALSKTEQEALVEEDWRQWQREQERRLMIQAMYTSRCDPILPNPALDDAQL